VESLDFFQLKLKVTLARCCKKVVDFPLLISLVEFTNEQIIAFKEEN